MANIVTGCRMLLSGLLLFIPALTPGFWAVYAAAGLSDMLDGPSQGTPAQPATWAPGWTPWRTCCSRRHA